MEPFYGNANEDNVYNMGYNLSWRQIKVVSGKKSAKKHFHVLTTNLLSEAALGKYREYWILS
jgi:uncharacterized protein YggU (UPF0235/DUF167 family)